MFVPLEKLGYCRGAKERKAMVDAFRLPLKYNG